MSKERGNNRPLYVLLFLVILLALSWVASVCINIATKF